MRICISIFLLLVTGLSYCQIGHSYANWNESSQTYSTSSLFTYEAVSEDYGPRILNNAYQFHGGIDIGKDDVDNPSISKDAIVAPFDGTIEEISVSGIKDLIIKKNGSNDIIGYRHLFEGASTSTQIYGGFALKLIDNSTSIYAIIDLNSEVAYCSIHGQQISYDFNNNGQIESQEIINTTKTFNIGDLLGPIGNSNGSYAYHFHIQYFKELIFNSQTGDINIDSTFSDINSKNPLYIISHVGTDFNIDINEPIVYPSINNYRIRAHIGSNNIIPSSNKRYKNGIFDIEKVSLYIKSILNNEHLKLERLNGTPIEISFGDETNIAEPSIIYNNLSSNWITSRKIDPRAYSTQRYDDFYLSLENIHIRKKTNNINYLDNSNNAKLNPDASYKDGVYNWFAKIQTISNSNGFESNNPNQNSIDNFLPYIKKVTLTDANGIFYKGEWNLNNMQNALEFQYCSTGANTRQSFDIEVETSESLNNLSLTISPSINNISLIPNSDKTIWSFSFATSFDNSVHNLEFSGTDLANNFLLTNPTNLYYKTGEEQWFSETLNQSFSGNLNNQGVTGSDSIHQFNLPQHLSQDCINNTSCNTDYEPNNTQSQATPLYVFGHDFSWSDSLTDECLDQATADIDWYRLNLTHQGELTITLSSQQISTLSMDWLDNGNVTSSNTVNGNKQIVICSNNGPACYDTALRIYTVTQNENDPIPYTLNIQWSAGQSCTSGRLSNTNNSTQNNSSITINGNTSVCEGLSNTLSVSGTSGPFDWFVNGQSAHIGNTFNTQSLNTGQYDLFVIATDDVCSFTETQLSITSGVTANAGTNITIQNGGSTTLQGSGGTSCSWSPTTGLSNPNSCNPTASPTQTTTYTLTVTEDGCTDTDQVTITVNGSGGNEPDNDNCNDAINLTSNTNCNYTFGTIDHATADGFPNNPSCDAQTNPNAFGVFYSFIAVNNTHNVTVNPTGALDAVLAVYSGNNCFGLSEFDCDDSSGVGSATITNNNFVIGQEYWIRVYDYGTSEPAIGQGGFNICVTHQENNADGIDLVSNITGVSDNNPDAGDTITIDYTASNIGDEDTTTLPTISFYLSSNTTLSGSDDFLNTEAILQTIDANETINGDIEVNLPNVSDGQYYLVSAIDNIYLIDESNENNNLDFFSIQIGDVAQNGPDLDVRRVRAVPDTELVPGQEVELEIRIENEGTEDVNDFEVLVFLDIDDDGDPDSNELMGTFTFNGLDVDEDETVFEDFDLPTYIPSAGTYDLIAIADSDNQINEPNENNNDDNDRVTIALASTYTDDVTILNESVIETNVYAGGTINVAANHIYLGSNSTSDLPTLRLGYYLSTDCNFSYAEDVYLGDDTSNLGINNPNIDEDSVLTIPLATPSGTYYILFVADGENLIDEGVLENNNVSCVEITVNGTSTPEGDIFITDEVCNPYIVAIGSEVEVYTNINYSGNQLNADIPSIDVFYFLSTDCVLSNDDILVSDDSVSLGSDIPVNDVTEAIELPSNLNPGTYFILIRADVENGVYETNENNNIACVEFSLFTANSNYQDVTLSYPNVDVTEANLGDQVYISVFQNYTGYQIDADLSSVRVHYFLSTDCILDSEDYYLEDDPSGIGSDDPSELETQTVTIPSDVSSGQYYILFVADATDIVTENNENNNLECVPITINDSTLSLEEYELSNQIKIYPNPVHDILTLNLGSTFSEITVDVFNLVGQKINSYTFKNKQVLKISTSQFSNGMYFLNIKTNFGITKPFKIIKK